MIEGFYQSKDVRHILELSPRQYQSGQGRKEPSKSCSMYSVEGKLTKQGDKNERV